MGMRWRAIQAGARKPQPPPRLYAASALRGRHWETGKAGASPRPASQETSLAQTVTDGVFREGLRPPGLAPLWPTFPGSKGNDMKTLTTTGAFALLAGPALAHHPLAGAPMETFAHGLLSGIGHPVLGFDHLFFVALLGVAAALTRRAALAPLGYIAGMLAGLALILAGIALPAVELVIAISLLTMGAILLSGRAMTLPGTMLAFCAFGLFHGWAFGGALMGQEGGAAAPVIFGYVLGLAAIQYVIASAFALLIRKLGEPASAKALHPRLAGAMVSGVGLFLVLEAAEGPALSALGLG